MSLRGPIRAVFFGHNPKFRKMDVPFTIALDAMGSDLGPDEVVAGAAIALKKRLTPAGILLVGREDELQTALKKHKLQDHPRINTFHASEVIGMHEKPIQSLKKNKDASLVRAVELVKLGTCSAAVSCGNTGSLMACSTLRLRPLEGVHKPALATVWPSKDTHFVLLDAGANPQCKPEHLLQYAVLGDLYAKAALGLEKPRVGLLTIGTEEGKGNELTAQAHELLKSIDGELIHYAGLIEGFQLFDNVVDVVVTDGFTGNIVLKSCESLYKMLKGLIKEEVKRNPLRLFGAGCLAGAFKNTRKRLDPDLYGGAPMLGLGGMVIKAHGSSNRNAIANAVRIAGRIVESEHRQQATEAIQRANQLTRPSKKRSGEES